MINNDSHNFEWVEIKTEPQEELNEILDIKEEIPDTKSIVLKFKKEINGNYSVIPLLTPDPFFEVNLEDDKTSIVKLNQDIEEKPTATSDDCNNNTNLIDRFCERCFFYTHNKFKQKLKKHQQRAHPSKTRSCMFCNQENFKELISLQMHFLCHHRSNEEAMQLITKPIFSCERCPYRSLKKNNYKRHLMTHQPKTHSKDINKGNTYNCYHCPYGVKDKGSIIKHVRLHKPAKYKPYTCTECDTKYNEKSCLDSHIVKRHLDNEELIASLTNKIYTCEFCNYKDVNKAKVLRHQKRHLKKRYVQI